MMYYMYNVYVYVYVKQYVDVHVCVCMFMSVYMCMYMCMYMYACMHVSLSADLFICIYTYFGRMVIRFLSKMQSTATAATASGSAFFGRLHRLSGGPR